MIADQVRAIFFDAVGTLIHPDPPAAVVYAEVGGRFGSQYTIEAIQSRFADAFAREEAADIAGNLRTSEERERRRWRSIVGTVLDDVTHPEACFQELYQHFARPNAWRLEDTAPAAIQRLAAQGYGLGLASNYDHRLRSVVAGFPAMQLLPRLIISSEVGWRKPARQFFEAMCQSVRLPTGQVLYVGDDPDNDYEGARAAGLEALLFDRQDRHSAFAGERLQRLADL
jgi:putative hydrolase of the HAD superfamily